MHLLLYSSEHNCRGSQIAHFWKKNPQVHLIIVREWSKNNFPILRNLGNFPPDAIYSPPIPHPFTIRHGRVMIASFFFSSFFFYLSFSIYLFIYLFNLFNVLWRKVYKQTDQLVMNE